ncbi:MAG TPA: hypothetical protein VFX70_22290, partial [Mycobacteriales bacterium]|nr:hypothetical protein [Mycobacteriales bacterium]
GSARRDGRPASYPSAAGSGPTRRARRVLAGAVAGLAFGVCVATASTSVSAHTDTPDRNIVHDVNGGVVRPPITGELTGVRDLRAPDRDQGTFGRTGPDGFGPDRPQPVSHQVGSGRVGVGAPARTELVSRAGVR